MVEWSLAAVAALALAALLARRARRARRHCLYCAQPRAWARRALAGGCPLCRACRIQERYAARAGLGVVYRAALVAAWNTGAYGPALWQRVGNALFYAGLAQQRVPVVGEEAAIREAISLGVALAVRRERDGRGTP